MTKFKMKPLLSLLLALVMVLTMLPMSVLAAEAPETKADTIYDLQPDTVPEICTEETCTHELEAEESTEEVPAPSEETQPETDESADTPAADPEEIPAPDLSATPDSSPLQWEIESDGTLFISGSGYVEPFNSAGDQPWQDVRQQITSVRFELSAALEIYDLRYWFDGCVNLSDIAVPVYVIQICPLDFTECDALRQLTYGGVDVLAEIKADYNNQTDTEPTHNETMDNGIMLFSSSNCGVLQCTCTRSCSWGYRNYRVAPESNNYHIMTVYCNTCGRTDGIIVSGSHSYSSNGYCSLCGYYNSAYDTTICYHTSTKTTWVTSCYWEKYCSNCGAYVSSGTSHGPYTYGSWSYYSSSQHRRSYTCSYGDSGTYYEYGSHSTSTSYSPYSSTQHSVSRYCSTCATTISTSYASHSFQYGAWESYSGSQHRRLKTCSVCQYSEYEYENHSLVYGTWTSISDTQHQRTNSCSCGYSTTETASHADADGDGYCDGCGYLLTH
ncbi:MAG: hypothetical protein VB060_03600, partial [Oscillibacter sp.]